MASLLVGWGIGKDLKSEIAVQQAIKQALSQIGMAQPAAVLILSSLDFHKEMLEDVSNLLGNVPVWGFSTAAPFDEQGEYPGSIMAVVLAGRDVFVRVGWWLDALKESASLTEAIKQFLSIKNDSQYYLVAGDRNHTIPFPILSLFCDQVFPAAGALACSRPDSSESYQIGNRQSSPDAISILALGGEVELHLGLGNGWQDVGMTFQITNAKDQMLFSLDDQPPAEVYAQIFGKPASAWCNPPFSEIIRLYPLGIELFPGSLEIVMCSPLKVQPDGSFLMNAPIIEGQIAHLMVGNIENCMEAAQSAARQALQSAGKSKPLFAMMWVDLAWRTLFHGDIRPAIKSIEQALGQVPILGAYTSGQLFRPSASSALQKYNQNVLIVLFCQRNNGDFPD
jgi:hypothetical protein